MLDRRTLPFAIWKREELIMFGMQRWLQDKPGVPLTRSAHFRRTSTYKVLCTVEAACREAAKCGGSTGLRSWLSPYRQDLRGIYADFNPNCNEGETGIIRWYMTSCPLEMLPICIWLLGKCSNRFRLYGIGSYRHHVWSRVRVQVAKALRRSEAWKLLKDMAATYPYDARIEWYASAPNTPRPFGERLSQFAKTIDDSHAGEVVTPSRMPYWAMEKSWDYSPPKSIAAIRRMLRRIRHWVRWGVS
jgi:hypothetical protein